MYMFTCNPTKIAQKTDIISDMQLYSTGYEDLPSSRRLSEALVVMDGDVSRRRFETSHSPDRTRYMTPSKWQERRANEGKCDTSTQPRVHPPDVDVGQVEKGCRAHGAARGFAADKHEPRCRPVRADE
jgi:hypothetical protein